MTTIKFNEIIKNKEYKERVIKFFRLPIRVTVSLAKFENYMSFLEKTDKEKYEMIVSYTENDFNYEAKRQGTSEPDFTMEYIIEPLIEKIGETKEWKEFAEEDYSDTLGDYDGATNIHQFYKEENDGKYFLSVDLVSANWQSLNKVIGMNENYEEFISKYTDNKIPPISKTFRTKVTSLLNAKKIMDYNKHLLNVSKKPILEVVKSETGLDYVEEKPFAFYADEFLIEISKEDVEKLHELNLGDLEDKVSEKVGVDVHLTPFKLQWLGLNKSCMKIYKDNAEVINLSKDIALMIDKKMMGIPLDDIDFEGVKVKMSKEELLEKVDKIAEELKSHKE